MDKRLDCEIVRDLLPSYVDGLTSSITNKTLQEHLADCTDCAAALQRMKEPDPQEVLPAAEVDYLKKIRIHIRRTSLLIGIGLMLLGMSLLSYRYFHVGSEASDTEVACNVTVEGDTVSLDGTLITSGMGVSRVTFSDSGGMVQFKVYTAPKAFFNSGDFSETYKALGVIRQVRIDDRIIWENGVEIGFTTAQLFAASNPYVGDMQSNGRIASILGVGDQFGPYTNELQTSKEPYGWTLKLKKSIAQEEESAARDIMSADSYAMLAAIDNLGYVTWQYDTPTGRHEYTVTVEDATAYAGQDIKLFADSASQLQTLLQRLSIKWSGVR